MGAPLASDALACRMDQGGARMTDRKRHDVPTRGQQQSSDGHFRESPDSADDRGLNRDRRSFSGDREHDELGSEMEDDFAADASDDMNMDDGLGGPAREK
jgi:hypothetical protein